MWSNTWGKKKRCHALVPFLPHFRLFYSCCLVKALLLLPNHHLMCWLDRVLRLIKSCDIFHVWSLGPLKFSFCRLNPQFYWIEFEILFCVQSTLVQDKPLKNQPITTCCVPLVIFVSPINPSWGLCHSPNIYLPSKTRTKRYSKPRKKKKRTVIPF